MAKTTRKIAAFALALSVSSGNAIPAYSVGAFVARPAVCVRIPADAINAALVWVRFSPHPEIFKETAARRHHAARFHSPRAGRVQPVPDHSFLADSIHQLIEDFEWTYARTDKPALSQTELATVIDGIKNRQRAIFDKLESIKNGPGLSLYSFVEIGENRLLSGHYGFLDWSLITVPGLQIKEVAKALHDSEYPDEFKEGLRAAIASKTMRTTAMKGWNIYVEGIPAHDFEGTIQPIIDSYIAGEASRFSDANLKAQLGRLPVGKAHVQVYLKAAPKGSKIRDIENKLAVLDQRFENETLSPAAYEEKTFEERRRYMIRLDELLIARRTLWSQAADYWVHQKEIGSDRDKASKYVERLLIDGIIRLNELEATKNAITPLRALLVEAWKAAHPDHQGNGLLEKIPLLDHDTVSQVKKMMETQPARADLVALFELFRDGRRKFVSLLNYRSLRLPRSLRLGPARVLESTQKDLERLKGVPDAITLENIKKNYLDYQTRLVESLVYAYRLPRSVEAYRLAYIGDVATAYEQNRFDDLRHHVERLIVLWYRQPMDSRVEREIYNLTVMVKLLQPAPLVFKRDVGDDFGSAVWHPGEGWEVGGVEINGFHPYTLAHPPDEIDSVMHSLVISFINKVRRPGPLADNIREWQETEIPKVAPEEFQKIIKDGDVRLRTYSTDENPIEGISTPYARLADGTVLVKKWYWGGLRPRYGWRPTALPRGAELYKWMDTLSAAGIVMKKRVSANDIAATFNDLMEVRVGKQKGTALARHVAFIDELGQLVPAHPASHALQRAA